MEAYKNEFIKQSKNELKPTYSDMTLALPFVSLFRPTYIACNLVKKNYTYIIRPNLIVLSTISYDLLLELELLHYV